MAQQRVPDEILLDILEYAADRTQGEQYRTSTTTGTSETFRDGTVSGDLYRLCLVSRKFNAIVEPLLYREIRPHAGNTVKLIGTLLRAPRLARMVVSAWLPAVDGGVAELLALSEALENARVVGRHIRLAIMWFEELQSIQGTHCTRRDGLLQLLVLLIVSVCGDIESLTMNVEDFGEVGVLFANHARYCFEPGRVPTANPHFYQGPFMHLRSLTLGTKEHWMGTNLRDALRMNTHVCCKNFPPSLQSFAVVGPQSHILEIAGRNTRLPRLNFKKFSVSSSSISTGVELEHLLKSMPMLEDLDLSWTERFEPALPELGLTVPPIWGEFGRVLREHGGNLQTVRLDPVGAHDAQLGRGVPGGRNDFGVLGHDRVGTLRSLEKLRKLDMPLGALTGIGQSVQLGEVLPGSLESLGLGGYTGDERETAAEQVAMLREGGGLPLLSDVRFFGHFGQAD